MLNSNQTQELAKIFSIDTFSVIREYLQLSFLNELYKSKLGEKIFFKGGTAIHLLFNSPRFSEDLDFSTILKPKEISLLLVNLEKDLQKEFSNLKILIVYKGKKGLRYRINYQDILLKYPLNIRLDFSFITKTPRDEASPLVTKFPLMFFPIIKHLSAEEILAEKIRAILTREKGRDYFDFWYLLEKGIIMEPKIAALKMAEVKKEYKKNNLINKIKKASVKKIELDLKQFLPAVYRKMIPELPKRILAKI